MGIHNNQTHTKYYHPLLSLLAPSEHYTSRLTPIRYGEEVCHIADILRTHKGFLNVDLSENKIPVSGADSISKALMENKVLEVIKLDRNDFGDEGIAFIANALKVNKTLR